jgi:hypothetical protein
MKTKIWSVIPTVIIAFMAGYFFKWLTKDHSITDAETTIWLAALGTICTIVGAFVLGERQIHVLWKSTRLTSEQCESKKHASILAMATAAYSAMGRLDGQYRNTLQERMRIRVAYHADTFASLIEALATIPLHELDSAETAIAMAGLKKNMIDAQQLIDQFIAARNKPEEILFSESKGIDLRLCKTHAESHYQVLTRALEPVSRFKHEAIS